MPLKTIDPATLKQWITRDEAVIIDVREPEEHQEINIPEATLIPLATVCKAKLPLATDKKIVIHCRSGKRSMSACEKLLAEDPSLELYNLEGGIMGWAEFERITRHSS